MVSRPTDTRGSSPRFAKDFLMVDLWRAGTWGSNLRAILPDADWRTISRTCSIEAGGKCQVCRSPGRS